MGYKLHKARVILGRIVVTEARKGKEVQNKEKRDNVQNEFVFIIVFFLFL